MTAQDLLEMPLPSMRWLVNELVGPGVILLCGTPKVGKSFFCLELGLCVSMGIPFLDHETCLGDVLYLSLEDGMERLQRRLFALVDQANDRLGFDTFAATIGNGLLVQLNGYVDEHPDARLIIIDTLQRVRDARSVKEDAYAVDYRDIGLLKRFAEERSLTVLLVHHTRKLGDEGNVFNMVLGGNGLIGSADGALMLTKRNFFDEEAVLSITGRDVEASEHKLRFKDLKWEYVGRTSTEEIAERAMPEVVKAIASFMLGRSNDWQGTASELAQEIGYGGDDAPAVGKYANQYKDFLREKGIEYRYRRTSKARIIGLHLILDSAEKPGK